MLITNADIVLPERVMHGSLRITSGLIADVSEHIAPQPGEEIMDADGMIVMPGVVDCHTHGSGGYDFMDGTEEEAEEAALSLAKHGTTACLPTSLTSSDDDLFLFLRNIRKARDAGRGARILGVHLEGPYFDMEMKGAQDPRYIRNPDPSHYYRILECADGLIRRWTVAPELPGAMEFIRTLSGMGITVSCGHTAATYDQISEAYDSGASELTHFYSGMSSIVRRGGFRVLGAVEAGYLIDDMYAEIIADGMHLPPELLEFIFRFKRKDRIVGCSDSMRGAGMPEGPSILGPKSNGTAVIIEDGIAKMPDRTCFAGSVATGERMVQTLVLTMGMTPEDAAAILSLQPARTIGMDSSIGSIEKGKNADLLLFDSSMKLRSTLIGGSVVR